VAPHTMKCVFCCDCGEQVEVLFDLYTNAPRLEAEAEEEASRRIFEAYDAAYDAWCETATEEKQEAFDNLDCGQKERFLKSFIRRQERKAAKIRLRTPNALLLTADV
jgi:hypothetical protein